MKPNETKIESVSVQNPKFPGFKFKNFPYASLLEALASLVTHPNLFNGFPVVIFFKFGNFGPHNFSPQPKYNPETAAKQENNINIQPQYKSCVAGIDEMQFAITTMVKMDCVSQRPAGEMANHERPKQRPVAANMPVKHAIATAKKPASF